MTRQQRLIWDALKGQVKVIVKKRCGRSQLMKIFLNGHEYEVRAIPKRLKGQFNVEKV